MIDDISSQADLIKAGVYASVVKLRTSIPGVIKSFDPTTQMAEVQPVVSSVYVVDGEEVVVDLPVLINVKVVFPRSGGYSITTPVVPGDGCVVCAFDRDVSRWLATGQIGRPATLRTHDLSSAYCIIGLTPDGGQITSFDNTSIEIRNDDGTEKIVVSSASGISIQSEKPMNISTTSNLVLGASHIKLDAPVVDVNGVDVALHVHQTTDGATAVASTSPAAPPP